MNDTIVALSSGALPAAIAVLRLSGPQAFAAASAICGKLPPPREARVRALRHDGQLLDRALLLAFPGPDTATGEDMVEFHLHGGRAVVRAVEHALLAEPQVRQAVQGEFTRRALTNGRIDLIQAEALGDLLAAETEAQRRLAVDSGSGVLRRSIDELETHLLRASAAIELTLDFSDEEDAEGEAEIIDRVRHDLLSLLERIEAMTSTPTVDRLRDGYRVVLAGPPNVGKSTLLNRLTGRDAAIVSDIAGTTRDRIEVPVSREGVPFVLTDTAGINSNSTDPIEALGIDLTFRAIDGADVILWLGDDAAPPGAIAIHPKIDLTGRAAVPAGRHGLSAASGEGVDLLWTEILKRVHALLPPADGNALNDRQFGLLAECACFVRLAMGETQPLLMSEHLKRARNCLHRFTGKSGIEQVLDQLFAGFCIGK